MKSNKKIGGELFIALVGILAVVTGHYWIALVLFASVLLVQAIG